MQDVKTVLKDLNSSYSLQFKGTDLGKVSQHKNAGNQPFLTHSTFCSWLQFTGFKRIKGENHSQKECKISSFFKHNLLPPHHWNLKGQSSYCPKQYSSSSYAQYIVVHVHSRFKGPYGGIIFLTEYIWQLTKALLSAGNTHGWLIVLSYPECRNF